MYILMLGIEGNQIYEHPLYLNYTWVQWQNEGCIPVTDDGQLFTAEEHLIINTLSSINANLLKVMLWWYEIYILQLHKINILFIITKFYILANTYNIICS